VIEDIRSAHQSAAARAIRRNSIPVTALLDRLLILNRRHLERVLPAYIQHYNAHRPHRSLNQRPPDAGEPEPEPKPFTDLDRIRSRDVLGGLIHEYKAAA
jgi:putative transposase